MNAYNIMTIMLNLMIGSTRNSIVNVGVILYVNVLRRFQVKSVGVSGVEDDEDGAPAAAQNKSSN